MKIHLNNDNKSNYQNRKGHYMDKILDEKLREIVDLAKQAEVISQSIEEKKRTLSMLDEAAKHAKGMPTVVEYATKASEELKQEISAEEEKLQDLRNQIRAD